MSTSNSSARPSPPAGRDRDPGEAAALVAQTRELFVELLTQRLDRMFEGADDYLFEMAGRARDNEAQRLYFDTMRVVRKNRPGMASLFREALIDGFRPQAVIENKVERREISFEELSLQEAHAIEETIALTNMITRAEAGYARELWEIGRRLEWLIADCGAPISRQALSPTLICNAFRASTESLEVEFSIELVIYKLFEKRVIGELGEPYAALLRFFDGHKIQAAPLAASRGAAPAAATAGAAGAAAAGVGAVGAGAGAAPAPLAGAGGAPPPSAERGSAPSLFARLAALLGGGDAAAAAGAGSGLHGPAGAAGSATEAFVPAPGYGGAPADGSFAAPAGGPFGAPAGGSFTAAADGFFAAPAGGYFTAPAGSGLSAIPAGQGLALDPQTLGSLATVAGRARLQHYSDADLAADIAGAAQGRLVAGWGPRQAQALVQRTGLVGQMFNDILADPHLAEGVKSRFADLRFAVIKSAVKDASFFADLQHPVRALVNEMALLAASARAGDGAQLQRVGDLVSRIQEQFVAAAREVREAVPEVEPLAETDIERFLDQQLVQSKARREALIARANRVVAEELQLLLGSRKLPAAATELIRAGWSPLMALRLVQHGMDSQEWRDGIVMFKRIVHALEPRMSALRRAFELEELLADIEDDLVEAGMQGKEIRPLIHAYRAALEAVDAFPGQAPAEPATAPEPPPAETPEALMRRMLTPGAWFHVRDPATAEQRWLKVVTVREEVGARSTVTFAEFTGRNPLTLAIDVLRDDLVAGRAEPFDQSPAARHALNALRQRPPG